MNDARGLLERVGERFPFPDGALDRLDRRRERKQQHQRVAAITLVVAIATLLAFVAANTSPLGGKLPVGEDPQTSPSPEVQGRMYYVDVVTGETSPLPGTVAQGNVSADRSSIVFDAIVGGSDHEIFTANLDGADVRQLTDSPSTRTQAWGPSWSPDGSTVVYQEWDWGTVPDGVVGNIFTIDLRTQTRTQITRLPPRLGSPVHWYMGPSFSDDGETIVFETPSIAGGSSWDLWSVPATGGKRTLIRTDAVSGAYSPDGSTIAYVRSPEHVGGGLLLGDAIMIANVDGSDPRPIVEGEGVSWPQWSPDGTRIAYSKGGSETFVVDVATGETNKVADDGIPTWFDDDTLIVSSDWN